MEDSRSKMEYYSSHISKLIEQLSRLPGIGAKSAQRLAFHIINMPQDQVEQLAGAMTSARSNVRYCKECFTLTDQELCPICANPKRNHKQIMVVENTRDLAAYEKPASTRACTMSFTELFPRCWGSVREISG